MVASLGVDSGYVPYTAFSAKQSYIKKHPDVIQAFTNALQQGMEYVNTHTPEEIAASIQPQFIETDTATITTINPVVIRSRIHGREILCFQRIVLHCC